jgi:alpha-L-fucosidase
MEQRLAWYQEARFGLFIHWGIYTVAGVEASWPIMAPDLSEAMFRTQARITEKEYRELANRFNPVNFDPDAWIKTAKEAGMRYLVFTAKHHDGFCMFDAPGTDYKITRTPYGKDICLELAQACARADFPLGFYYSPPDMHHPGYRDTRKPATQNWTGESKRREWGSYLDYMESHLRKLLTGYGPVKVIWFDGLANHGKYDPPRFHKLIHELSPDTLINDRLGDDYDFVTPEQFIPKLGIPARTGKPAPGLDPGGDGFFRTVCTLFKIPGIRGWIRSQMGKYADGTLELTPVHQEPYPSPERFQPWETCMTIGQSWAYNPQESNWKPAGTLIRNLVRVVSRGGNYLLNVGPTALGGFPTEAVQRLQGIGKWMETNHEAIYGTTYTPLNGLAWGQATRKGNTVYLHVFDWPTTGKLEIDPFPGNAQAVRLLSGGEVDFTQNGLNLEIHLPQQKPDPEVSVLVVTIAGVEKGWGEYSAPVSATTPLKKYIQSQAITVGWINALINGLIAFFTYRSRGVVPFSEASVDIPITVFILVFLVIWLMVGGVRQQFAKGNLERPAASRRGLKLPKGPALRALVLALVSSILYGGLILDGIFYLLWPEGVSGLGYFGIKTVYTGITAALASVLTILSVVDDERR